VFVPKKIINPNIEDNQGPQQLKLKKPEIQCGENQKLINGRCVTDCPDGERFAGGKCRPIGGGGLRIQQD